LAYLRFLVEDARLPTRGSVLACGRVPGGGGAFRRRKSGGAAEGRGRALLGIDTGSADGPRAKPQGQGRWALGCCKRDLVLMTLHEQNRV
jgi:hypothetical protein